jgi:phytol kinase
MARGASPALLTLHRKDMKDPWIGILLVVLASAGMLGLVAILCMPQRSRESSRKMLHVGMGIIILQWPWLFDRAWPALILSGGYVGALAARGWCAPLDFRLSKVVYCVDRKSGGEYWFAVAVALLFVLAHGQAILFCVPVATLTFADAAAAMVGRRYGLHPYPALGGIKSWEGSLAFFVSAFFIIHVPLVMSGHLSGGRELATSLGAALIGTLLESLSGLGIDNLLVPVGVFAVMRLMAG